MLFFRVRDNSILPPRLPICVGSDGVEEEMGSVNCGCGSQIIFGFQLGESFGSLSWKARGRYFVSGLACTTPSPTTLQTHGTDRRRGRRFASSVRHIGELHPKQGDAFDLQVFVRKSGRLMHVDVRVLLIRLITVNNPGKKPTGINEITANLRQVNLPRFNHEL